MEERFCQSCLWETVTSTTAPKRTAAKEPTTAATATPAAPSPATVENVPGMTPDSARAMMREFLPALKRWK